MTKKNILIVSGEPSGDLHASNLVRELKKIDPNIRFFGMGGKLSAAEGVEIVFDISSIALVGVIEVLKNIFTVGKAFNSVLKKIDSDRPEAAILVDYPGFNLRLARQLKKRSIPVIYYISPQVWAWGENRIKIIKECVKKILVFFKFEEDLYRKHGIDVEFTGHPLIDVVKVTASKEDTLKRYGLSKEKKTVALLAGSRRMEIKVLLPLLAGAAEIISKNPVNVQFIISKHPDTGAELYKDILKRYKLEYRMVEGDVYNVLAASDIAIVASGTATLETAITGTPLVIIYKTNALTYILGKMVAKTRFLGLVNIIAGRELAPELLQNNATPEKIAAKTAGMLGDESKLQAMRKDLKKISSSLGPEGAYMKAAKAILPLL